MKEKKRGTQAVEIARIKEQSRYEHVMGMRTVESQPGGRGWKEGCGARIWIRKNGSDDRGPQKPGRGAQTGGPSPLEGQ